MKLSPLRIPIAIWLHAQRIEVELRDDLVHHEDVLGHAALREAKIRLQASVPGKPRSQTEIEETYLHAVLHWIFHVMREDELRDNEKLIARMARLLHQVLTMAEYAPLMSIESTHGVVNDVQKAVDILMAKAWKDGDRG